jgi:ribonuclease P protein component
MESLKKNAQYQRVYKLGKSMACRCLVLYVYPNGDETLNRLGVSVSRKVGGAVVRNRIKRRVKESFRQIKGNMQAGYDMIVVVRVSCGAVSGNTMYENVNRSLRYLLKKQGILL